VKFNKTVLQNGVRVLSERHSDSRCVVTGFWVEAGARFEESHQIGISHLLEHMVFKGTEKYNALELALTMEAKGGDINAFTAREHTCFHTTSLSEDLNLSVDVLSQLIAFAKLEDKELTKEKGVVQQEILMASDDLEEYAYDLYYEKIFPGNSLGYQILGTSESVESLSQQDIQSYYDKHFVPENIIVTAAGDVDHDLLVRLVQENLQNKTWTQKKTETPLITPPRSRVHEFHQKDCEQYHIIVGFPACSYSAAHRFNAFVVNTALGGGMTSKLYQSVREERGLAYSIFSMLNTYTDTGIQTIYAGTEKKHVEEVVDLIQKELKALRDRGLSKAEIELYKTQAKGQIVIGSEDIDNRMNSIAVNEMVFNEYRPVDQVIADIEKVNSDSVMQYVEEYLDPSQLSLFLLGPEAIELPI
jgi:predicted Zn-dependent peptidase